MSGSSMPDGRGQIVAVDLGFGIFQRPGDMVQIGPDRLARPVGAEQAVALGEEMLQRCQTNLGELVLGPSPR